MILFLPLLSLAIPVPLFAQANAGDGSPGSGGFVPELSSPQPWMGRSNYALRIENGLGGANALFGICAAPAAFTWNGAPAWMDTTRLVFRLGLTLGGTPGSPGAGFFDIPMTLPVPNNALAGRTFWAQAAIFDAGAAPAGVCTSNAIALTLTLRPKVLVGTNMGSPSNWYSVDGPSMAPGSSGNFSFNLMGGASRLGGLDEYLAVSGEGVYHGDWSSGSLVWNLLWSDYPSIVEGLELDEARNLLWTMVNDSSGQEELVAIDVDASSLTYGQTAVMTSGVGAVGIVQPWALSADGNTAAVVKILSDSVYLWDLDPASATYLQNTALLDVPAHNNSVIHLVTTVAFSPDGQELVALVQHAGSTNAEVGRYDRGAGLWIDHDPTALGAQCLGDLSVPALAMGSAPTGISISREGWFMVSGFGTPLGGGQGSAGWVGRVDLTPLIGTGFLWTPYTGGTVNDSWRIALDRDDAVLAVGTPGDSAGDLQFLDATTFALQGAVNLSGIRNIKHLTWR